MLRLPCASSSFAITSSKAPTAASRARIERRVAGSGSFQKPLGEKKRNGAGGSTGAGGFAGVSLLAGGAPVRDPPEGSELPDEGSELPQLS